MNRNVPKPDRGMALVELAIALPVLLMLGLGVAQIGLLYQSRSIVNFATFEAARKGAVNHALSEPMIAELGVRLAALQGGDDSVSSAARAMARSIAETSLGEFTELEILNPTSQAFADWGVRNTSENVIEIPNSHLRHRDADIGSSSGVSLRDANLLRIKVRHGVELKVPFVDTVIAMVMAKADPGNRRYYDAGRVPVTSVATVRMQSAARRSADIAAGAVQGEELGEGAAPVNSVEPVTEVPCDEYGFRIDADPAVFDALLNRPDETPGDCDANYNPLDTLLNTTVSGLPGPHGESESTLTDCAPG